MTRKPLTLLYNSICPSARLFSISFISASFAYWKVVCSRRVSLLKVSDVSCAVVTASVSCLSCQRVCSRVKNHTHFFNFSIQLLHLLNPAPIVIRTPDCVHLVPKICTKAQA
jgi:hypothetical protein